jgi:hypothetical protein
MRSVELTAAATESSSATSTARLALGSLVDTNGATVKPKR